MGLPAAPRLPFISAVTNTHLLPPGCVVKLPLTSQVTETLIQISAEQVKPGGRNDAGFRVVATGTECDSQVLAAKGWQDRIWERRLSGHNPRFCGDSQLRRGQAYQQG